MTLAFDVQARIDAIDRRKLRIDRLARIPAEGEAFMMDGWRIEVIDMDGKRVDKLLFVPPEQPEAA